MYHLNEDDISNSYSRYQIRNVGWSVGRYCNANCSQCYSREVRKDGSMLTHEDVLTILDKLVILGVRSINLGGNEPIFTHGFNPKDSILPFIIYEVNRRGIALGITSNGTTMKLLYQLYPEAFEMVDDWDISLDSPFASEHNQNRESNLYDIAMEALDLSRNNNLRCSIVYCLMGFNCTTDHAKALSNLTRQYNVDLRINTLKPVSMDLCKLEASADQIFEFCKSLSNYYRVTHNSDLSMAISTDDPLSNCPCGKYSFSILPKRENSISITPCVYLHRYAVGNILTDDISNLLEERIFQLFRNNNMSACSCCEDTSLCSGGCLAYVLLTSQYGQCDSRCTVLRDLIPRLSPKSLLNTSGHHVHEDYLCTWMGVNE